MRNDLSWRQTADSFRAGSQLCDTRMIASFEHDFIFIKTRKTGGTSVEIYLSQFCGADDIVTPLTFEDERLRAPEPGVMVARNFAPSLDLDSRLRAAFAAEDENAYHLAKTEIRKRGGCYNHMPAAGIRRKLDRDFWERALKISVERHPYEKVVSRAYFNLRLNPGVPIELLLEKAVQETREAVDLYTIWGRVVVTEMLRQERLAEDLARLAKKLGIPPPDNLPRAKSAYRHDLRPAREILTEAQRRVIRRRHARTFKLLGYEA